MVSNPCAGRPRSVMMTGPLLAARFAPQASWLNYRLRLALSLSISSAAVWALGPVVKAAGFGTLFADQDAQV